MSPTTAPPQRMPPHVLCGVLDSRPFFASLNAAGGRRLRGRGAGACCVVCVCVGPGACLPRLWLVLPGLSAMAFLTGPWTVTCPPCVTVRRVAASLRGPGQSPVLPSACCVGSLRSDGRCGRCSCWCRSASAGPSGWHTGGCAGGWCGGHFMVLAAPPPPGILVVQHLPRCVSVGMWSGGLLFLHGALGSPLPPCPPRRAIQNCTAGTAPHWALQGWRAHGGWSAHMPSPHGLTSNPLALWGSPLQLKASRPEPTGDWNSERTDPGPHSIPPPSGVLLRRTEGMGGPGKWTGESQNPPSTPRSWPTPRNTWRKTRKRAGEAYDGGTKTDVCSILAPSWTWVAKWMPWGWCPL